ncbi:hypothetical protein Q7C36_011228 [Tachysurus vachellii]|uniref:Uncharacterized protein n=1 Tax=Tachysurus vachellii TaxID=175792 RepID=A0AA88MT63_TACVA|nr:hypothetical protein Q7C36_011228 [Tachysurus vachellii]
MSFDVVSIRSVARPRRVTGRHTFLLSSRLTRCIKDKPIPPGLIHSLHSLTERSSVSTECSSGISHSLLSTCRSRRMSSNPPLLNPFAPEKQRLAFYFRIRALLFLSLVCRLFCVYTLLRTLRTSAKCRPLLSFLLISVRPRLPRSSSDSLDWTSLRTYSMMPQYSNFKQHL